MKNIRRGSRFLTLFLALAMVVAMLPLSVSAAKGDLANVSTGLTGNIDTADTISLPIKILDYEADGMLFEFAEANGQKTAYDFGSNFCQPTDTVGDIANTASDGAYDDTTVTLKSNNYASYVRLTYAGKTNENWIGNKSGIWISTYNVKDSDGNWIHVLGSDLTDINDIHYVTIVYRSNVSSDNMYFAFGDNTTEANTSGHYTGAIPFSNSGDDGLGSKTNWTYAVYNLQTGTLANEWSSSHPLISDNPNRIYIGLPLDSSGEWIDLAHVAFFSDKDQATAFGEYALTDGSDRGDNRGFGLLRSSRTQSGTAYASIIDETTTVEQLNTYSFLSVDAGKGDYVYGGDDDGDGTKDTNEFDYVGFGNGNYTKTIFFEDITTLGYQLLGTFSERGIANVGLLQSGLSEKGYPVYKEEVVTYLANLLKHSLEISERTSDGWKNYRYIKGTASSVYGGTDLATALRNAIDDKTISNGDYDAAKGKTLVGAWSAVSENISTYHDAAYFLLNSIFVPGSYNTEKTDYNYLVLSAGTDSETGDKVYVFDGGFATSATPASAQMAIDYNTTNHTIQNTSAAGKAHFYYEDSNTTTLNPFTPVTDRNDASGMTKSPYYQDDGVINGVKKQTTKDTLYARNFNFAMVSEGEFVYHADDELFFEFEGDDDVYLFINGELVMDIGSAHSIDSVRFNLNDYVNAAKAGTLGSAARNNALALVEGETYEFKFYYMERHSYGSNIRICTNIRVTDPSMVTAKTAWQDGVQLDFGSVVDKDKVVEYGFAITNNGQENLHNLTFTDNDIGVTLDPTYGLKVTGSRVYDVNGGTLEATDLTAVVSHPNYADIHITFDDNEGLKDFLRDMTASEDTEDGAGLYIGATVLIRGIGYKLTNDQISEGVFYNTVLTTATNQTGSKTLQGQASMRVFVPADPMYYEWAGHDLSVTKAKLIEDIMGAITDPNNPLYEEYKDCKLTEANVNKIEYVTKAGNPISSSNVTIDSSSYNLTINYPIAGSKVFYVKVTYNGSNTIIIPVLVNVTDVEDKVIVLDYGLDVNLLENQEIFNGDTLSVPGRDTTYEFEGISNQDGSYTPNYITFYPATEKITGSYGNFQYANNELTYSPTKFMEGLDSAYVAVRVHEKDFNNNIGDIGIIDINNEVEMYKSITVLPANVVYYEDYFPAIKYKDINNTFESLDSQSADQDTPYGSDPYYQTAENAESSAGALTTITIKDNTTVASFTFTGTGFELIGRTNATDSATLVVEVKKDSSGGTVKKIPVITEFDNGGNGGAEEIYQVPVIRVKDLPIDTYTVEISGVPAGIYDENGNRNGTKTTYLYIDGLRIFQPMGATNANYNASENGAKFIEIRDKIADGEVAVVKYNETDGITVNAATSTWTENLIIEEYETETGDNGKPLYKYNEVDSVDDYLLKGPNNEVYMNGVNDKAALVFHVKEDESANHSFQIALRKIDYVSFFTGTSAESLTDAQKADFDSPVVMYGLGDTWKTLVDEVTSSTEQYYTINYTDCPQNDDGSYQVVIMVDNGMISYSSLKLTGLSLVNISGEPATVYYENGILKEKLSAESDSTDTVANAAAYVNFASLSAQMSSDVIIGEDEPDTPAEDLPTDEPETEAPETDVPAEPETPDVPEDKPEDKPTNNGRPSYVDISKTYRKLFDILRRLMAK